jgi:hypothetical protein
MIRLLEFPQREIFQAWVFEQAWIFEKTSKVDASANNGKERVNPRSTLVKDEADAAAYLRAAQAYMLISMPTGTSTIFGVFQAILALLVKPDELRPTQQGNTDRKVRQRNLFPKFRSFYAAPQHNSRACASARQTNDGSMGSYRGQQMLTAVRPAAANSR